jgi:2-polyprenyl-3-methyl-5-hydroxy-6-metoxy-1,4-benzoquinol methylase
VTLNLETATKADIEALPWYYSVELKPGAFTKGPPLGNLPPTRTLLDRIDFKGMKVLDIGSQEGVFCVLLTKAGARVTGYDRFDLA